jgi:hypothetical protein
MSSTRQGVILIDPKKLRKIMRMGDTKVILK